VRYKKIVIADIMIFYFKSDLTEYT